MARKRRKKKCRTICFSRKRNGEFGKGKCAPKRRRRKKSSHRARSSGRRRSAAYSPRKHPRKANGQFKHKTGKSRKRKKSSHRAKRAKYKAGHFSDIHDRKLYWGANG